MAVNTVAAVVLAAGASSRMGPEPGTRKQFLELTAGERIVDRVIATCRSAAGWVAVVVPPGQAWEGPPVDAVVDGGADRWTSVAVGVAAVPAEAGIVVVHSASHPLATAPLVRRLVTAVEGGADGAVPVLPAVDTIKRCNPDGTLTTIGRDGLAASQAPMAYRRAVLDRALAAAGVQIEESAAVEAVGGRVIAVDGELTNLHVTDSSSLAVVRHLATIVDGGSEAD
jgi:2-C-methyl-D-erythritol 4-phosphate cytidylyltransferase